MNRYINFIVSGALMMLVAAGCKKDENRVYFEGGTPPVLSASRTGNIPLSFSTQNNEAIKLSWTNPNYKFNTGVSSQNVNYQIEIDTAGANFNNPKKATISISNDLSKSFTQSELNSILLNQLVLDTSRTYNIQMRVRSFMGAGAVVMMSNVLTFTAKPYAIPPVVVPPAAGTLYITGSATPRSWMGGGDAPVASQQFTRVTSTLYVLNSIQLTGGGSYLFVPRYGNWSSVSPDPEKYGFTGSGNANNVDGDDFKAGGNDMKAPAATGNYKIEVDFQRGKFTVTKI